VHYNKLVDAARNKGAVLFNTAAVLMQHAFENRKSGTVQIVVDRQGGRASYTAGLRKMFPETDLTVIRQDSEDSSYELKSGDKTMRIHFVVGADDRFMPVSLASMVCKYVREILNECMNEHFLKLCPELKPTAGYWKDGTRFVEDLKKSLPDFASHSHKLIRIK
jgi:ribonuclease HII